MACNKNCKCEYTYSPVCSPKGTTYASPCISGCTFANSSVRNKNF